MMMVYINDDECELDTNDEENTDKKQELVYD